MSEVGIRFFVYQTEEAYFAIPDNIDPIHVWLSVGASIKPLYAVRVKPRRPDIDYIRKDEAA